MCSSALGRPRMNSESSDIAAVVHARPPSVKLASSAAPRSARTAALGGKLLPRLEATRMTDHPAWLAPALDYIPRWLGYQMRATEQPGCAIAVAFKGEVVLE